MELEKLITIDGGAHTGKSTAARRLAEWLGWDWVSTGAFYRGLACVSGIAGIGTSDEAGLLRLVQSGQFRVELTADITRFFYLGKDITSDIFTPWVGEITPFISRHPPVRNALLDSQRALAMSGKGLLAEGRDCGTVVFPAAPLKFFLTVSDKAAAQRLARANQMPLETALSHIRERNELDTKRTVAQLKPASDAIALDTSLLTADLVFAELQKCCVSRGFSSNR